MTTQHPYLLTFCLGMAVVTGLCWIRLKIIIRRLPMAAPLKEPRDFTTPISVILPARNEAACLGRTLKMIQAQEHVVIKEIFVVNDHSTDDTGAIADEAARNDPRIKVLHDPPMNEGWVGKQNAMQHAADQATGEILVFSDADIQHGPTSFAVALTEKEKARADLVSLMPRVEGHTIMEHAHIPNYVGFMLFILNLPTDDSMDHEPLAAGALIMLRRKLFESFGGYHPIRNKVVDDLEMARLVKAEGHHPVFRFAPDELQVRLFKGNLDAFWGATKNILLGMNFNPWLAAVAMFLPLAVYGAPIACMGLGLFLRDPLLLGSGLLTYILQYFMAWPIRMFWPWQLGRALFFPLVAIMDFCCIARALYYSLFRGGFIWRGRVNKLPSSS